MCGAGGCGEGCGKRRGVWGEGVGWGEKEEGKVKRDYGKRREETGTTGRMLRRDEGDGEIRKEKRTKGGYKEKRRVYRRGGRA